MNKALAVFGSVFVIGGAFFFLQHQAKKKPVSSQKEERQQATRRSLAPPSLIVREDPKGLMPEDSVRLGNPQAKVKLVEFLDPQCETCRAFAPLVKNIIEKSQGGVELIIRYAPFHAHALEAAKILEAARLQGKYFELMAIFFEKLPEWGGHHDARPEKLWVYARELGLDMDRLKKDIHSPKIKEILDRDQEDLKKYGVRATPTFFVNGEKLKEFGAQQLVDLISKHLKLQANQ